MDSIGVNEWNEERLSRIEDKLDKIADALVQLARIEERSLSQQKAIDSFYGQIRELHGRINDVNTRVNPVIEQNSNTSMIRWTERVVVGTVLAYFGIKND